MKNRTATALWYGTGKDGKGTLTTQSGALKNAAYSSASRFEDEMGTNPEELIAAAFAGCFTMKLGFIIAAKSITPDSLSTTATVSIESGHIPTIHLELTGKVPGLEDFNFQAMANEAKTTCPVGKLLNAQVTLTATLL
jgi:lipoyl-dependent peroxiredoxin